MLPTLLQFGPIHISSFGVCLAAGLLFFSFLAWYTARDRGVEDEKIVDNILVVSTLAFLGARIFFVFTHWDLFAPNLLRIFLVWKFPGLSFWGALLVALIGFYFYSRLQKLDRALLFDCYGTAMPAVFTLISFGVLLDGTVIGKPTSTFLGIPNVGVVGARHPVGLYGMILGILLFVIVIFLRRYGRAQNIPRSFVGWGAFLGIGLIQLTLAFARADLLYLGPVALDYAFAIILIVWPMGPLFVLVQGPKRLTRGLEQFKKRFLKK